MQERRFTNELDAVRQAALLWSRPLHTGSFAGTPGRLVWGWMAVAVVALGVSGRVTRRVRTLGARREAHRWQRQLRRRRVLARRERARAARIARTRRVNGRRLRRRRKVQARIGAVPVENDLTGPAVGTDLRDAAVETDLTDPALEIDLREPAVEIDLREPVAFESEITLETGETLESGIVACLPHR